MGHDQRLKNKIVSAILSYPPDTMSKAEFMADQILAALSHEWRPIETAPKGDRVLLKSGLNDRILIGFNVGDGWIESGSRHMSYPPTHWMPLPTPPLTKGGEGDG